MRTKVLISCFHYVREIFQQIIRKSCMDNLDINVKLVESKSSSRTKEVVMLTLHPCSSQQSPDSDRSPRCFIVSYPCSSEQSPDSDRSHRCISPLWRRACHSRPSPGRSGLHGSKNSHITPQQRTLSEASNLVIVCPIIVW